MVKAKPDDGTIYVASVHEQLHHFDQSNILYPLKEGYAQVTSIEIAKSKGYNTAASEKVYVYNQLLYLFFAHLPNGEENYLKINGTGFDEFTKQLDQIFKKDSSYYPPGGMSRGLMAILTGDKTHACGGDITNSQNAFVTGNANSTESQRRGMRATALLWTKFRELKKADPNNEYVKRVRSDPRFEILRTLQLIPEFETVALAKEIPSIEDKKK